MECGLMVTNLKSSVDENTIRAYFSKFGQVNYTNLVPDKFNSAHKVCYINFNNSDSARRAMEQTDKRSLCGNEVRVSLKVIKNNQSVQQNKSETSSIKSHTQENGFSHGCPSRTPSIGRGRGFNADGLKQSNAPCSVTLHYNDLPLHTRILVEIVDLPNLFYIMARPLEFTQESKQNLNECLISVNERIQSLVNVRLPEIDGFYLAKWEVDCKFYRAKLLEKLGNNQYKVCFVDEGTSGDIVTELKEIPRELMEFPCQFVTCDLECEDLPDLVQMIISSGESNDVSICVSSNELNSGKYRINLFLGGIDVVELYKNQSNRDPRKKPLPNLSGLRRHELRTKFDEFQIIDWPKESKDVFNVILTGKFDNNPKVESLQYAPIKDDLVVYRQSEHYLHRCVVESVTFENNKIVCSVKLLDENRSLEVPISSLLRTGDNCIYSAPRLLNCVLAHNCPLSHARDVSGQICIEDYDAKKNLYVINFIRSRAYVQPVPAPVSQTKSVFVSHMESCSEFYVQYTDAESLHQLELIQQTLNENYKQPKLVVKDMGLNKMVIAPFLGEYYRAILQDIDFARGVVKVFFLDYGNYDMVKSNDILYARDDIARLAPQAHKCKLNAVIKSICSKQADDLLRDFYEQAESCLSMNVLNNENEIMAVDLINGNKTSFIDTLKSNKFINEISTPVKRGNQGNGVQDNDIEARVRDLENRISHLEMLIGK